MLRWGSMRLAFFLALACVGCVEAAEAKKQARADDAGPAEVLDCEKVVGEAMDDYVHGRYETASSKARAASCRLTVDGGTPSISFVAARAHCRAHDAYRARVLWPNLSPHEQRILHYECKKFGVEVP